MGLTDDTTYYVRAIDSNTLAFYTSATNANSDTSRIDLTATGSETHYINSMDAAVFNNSGGTVTINIADLGDTPTVRNGPGSTTTVNNAVSLSVTVRNESAVAVSGVRVRIERESDGSLVAEGLTNVSGVYSTTYNGTLPLDVVIKTRLKRYIPFETSGTITSSGLDVQVRFIKDTIVD